MMGAARHAERDGVDLVLGIVETHGRGETEALLRDLEIIARRTIEYRGRAFQELDLDAVLARRPAVVLVDERDHTNNHGRRHLKRYQYVHDLLHAVLAVWAREGGRVWQECVRQCRSRGGRLAYNNHT